MINIPSDDYNSWQETPKSEEFKERLDTEVIVFEGESPATHVRCQIVDYVGYAQFKTRRRHMVKVGDWRNDPALEVPLDGVGGVSLLVRAEVHRKGDA